MRQTLISMFSTMLSLEKPDPVLNARLHKIATSMLCCSKQNNDAAAPVQLKITPTNIGFILELFRFAAKNQHAPCHSLNEVYKLCLDLVLPTDSSSVAEVQGFSDCAKTRQVVYADVCRSIQHLLTNEKAPLETKALFKSQLNTSRGLVWHTFMESTGETRL